MYPTKHVKPLLGWNYLQYASPQKTFHPGVDLGLPGQEDYGQEIYATKAGVVEYVNQKPTYYYSRGFGCFIVIKHNDGKYSRHAHLSGFPAGIKKGCEVGANDIIGYVGGSGGRYKDYSSHDHFEVFGEPMAELQRKHRTYGLARPWCFYPAGYSKKWVATYYLNPWEWLATVSDGKIPHWAIKPWQKAIKMGIAPDNPFTEIDMKEWQEVMVELKKIQKVGKMPAYRMIAMADKLGFLG